jgi:hypothetical protein
MARYSAFLGRSIEVQYRAGDICLPASGTFVGDSGRSIFLEQHYEQHGQPKNFRWEIPYQCIVRLEEIETFQNTVPVQSVQIDQIAVSPEPSLQASAAHASGGASLLPITQRPKTA